MVIATIDELVNALGNSAQSLVINKASIGTQITGGFTSLWRGTGTPAQGAIPGAAAVCTKSLTGAFQFENPTGGKSSYLGRLFALCANANQDIQFHDRLAHMGGLSGILTTSQTVGVDVSGAGSNMIARRGASDYSDVQWWLEWYTATGATNSPVCTVTYTNAAGTTGRTTTLAIPVSTAASRRLPIIGNAGEFIQSVQSVQNNLTTGVAGSFGVTASRALGGISLGLQNAGQVYDWQLLGLPKIEDDACLDMMMITSTTSTGVLYGNGKLIQG